MWFHLQCLITLIVPFSFFMRSNTCEKSIGQWSSNLWEGILCSKMCFKIVKIHCDCIRHQSFRGLQESQYSHSCHRNRQWLGSILRIYFGSVHKAIQSSDIARSMSWESVLPSLSPFGMPTVRRNCANVEFVTDE